MLYALIRQKRFGYCWYIYARISLAARYGLGYGRPVCGLLFINVHYSINCKSNEFLTA